MDVNNLLSGASPYQVLQEQAGKLASKWERSGLLEGIENSVEKNNMSITNHLKNILDRNIDAELLKRVVFARIDEIINFIFQDIDYSYLIKNSESSVLVFTGEGSKILNKNSIFLDEKFNYFNEINFFDENSTLVCDSGYKFITTDKPYEINVVPKKIGKYGFFEKIFNYFK